MNLLVMKSMLENINLAAKKFFAKEDGDVNIVAIVFLIAVAVALALIFKDQVTNLINTLFGNINEKAQQFTNS
ncbi:Flp1 family type IVb pilin [Helcococcus kunzii]|uniref:Putative Flagellin Flp1-like domain-containing protein n=1 Tax=Helcococcus kunzii ATCC 51366 TaxID=883114 RepID=H3NPV7_9FIRM|nr:Flp1 family type IVb pilin [Helcococcus kunzii]EHR33335.1 hypothetical protein HMPREF9709_01379 [Helcococcus kunzii ATCC 51366]MCT1795991.1 hypothetical protein [Helcococcus kunzii]MCT1988233.1 hypothetical protein [Helcococcus kunzii]QZO75928.1 hypothetical protein HIF96_06480 [Helcococcus kunzii]